MKSRATVEDESYWYCKIITYRKAWFTAEQARYVDPANGAWGNVYRTVVAVCPLESASNQRVDVLLLEIPEALLVGRGFTESDVFDMHFYISCCFATIIADAETEPCLLHAVEHVEV